MTKRSTIMIALVAIGGLIFVGASWSQQPGAAPVSRVSQSGDFTPSAEPVYIAVDGPTEAIPRRKNKRSESANTGPKIERLMNQLREDEEKKASKVSQPVTSSVSGTSSTSVTNSTPETPGDAQKKVELTKQLEAAVAEGFDEDMKVREGELSKLEERLGKLRAQLDRRRKAKSEIIQLEVKVLVNEAAGLGFSGGAPAGVGGGFSGRSFRRGNMPQLGEHDPFRRRSLPSAFEAPAVHSSEGESR